MNYLPFGDIVECDKWLPWAKGQLLRLQHTAPGTHTVVLYPVENVEAMIQTRPEKIMIKAGGDVFVTAYLTTAAQGAYPDDALPPYQAVMDRLLFSNKLSSFTVKPDFYGASDEYLWRNSVGYSGQNPGHWHSRKKVSAVSWAKDTVYIKGRFATIGGLWIIAAAIGVFKEVDGTKSPAIIVFSFNNTGNGQISYFKFVDDPLNKDRLILTSALTINVILNGVIGSSQNLGAFFNDKGDELFYHSLKPIADKTIYTGARIIWDCWKIALDNAVVSQGRVIELAKPYYTVSGSGGDAVVTPTVEFADSVFPNPPWYWKGSTFFMDFTAHSDFIKQRVLVNADNYNVLGAEVVNNKLKIVYTKINSPSWVVSNTRDDTGRYRRDHGTQTEFLITTIFDSEISIMPESLCIGEVDLSTNNFSVLYQGIETATSTINHIVNRFTDTVNDIETITDTDDKITYYFKLNGNCLEKNTLVFSKEKTDIRKVGDTTTTYNIGNSTYVSSGSNKAMLYAMPDTPVFPNYFNQMLASSGSGNAYNKNLLACLGGFDSNQKKPIIGINLNNALEGYEVIHLPGERYSVFSVTTTS